MGELLQRYFGNTALIPEKERRAASQEQKIYWALQTRHANRASIRRVLGDKAKDFLAKPEVQRMAVFGIIDQEILQNAHLYKEEKEPRKWDNSIRNATGQIRDFSHDQAEVREKMLEEAFSLIIWRGNYAAIRLAIKSKEFDRFFPSPRIKQLAKTRVIKELAGFNLQYMESAGDFFQEIGIFDDPEVQALGRQKVEEADGLRQEVGNAPYDKFILPEIRFLEKYGLN